MVTAVLGTNFCLKPLSPEVGQAALNDDIGVVNAGGWLGRMKRWKEQQMTVTDSSENKRTDKYRKGIRCLCTDCTLDVTGQPNSISMYTHARTHTHAHLLKSVMTLVSS